MAEVVETLARFDAPVADAGGIKVILPRSLERGLIEYSLPSVHGNRHHLRRSRELTLFAHVSRKRDSLRV